MRILYAGNVDLNQEKGDTIHYRSLAQALAAYGHSMTIVAFGSEEAISTNGLSISGLQAITLSKSSMPLFAKVWNDFKFFSILLWLGITAHYAWPKKFRTKAKKAAMEENFSETQYQAAAFDVIYHRGVTWANLCGRILRIPAISEVNGIQVDEIDAIGVAPWKLRLHAQRERMLVDGASGIICVTEGIRTQLVERYNVQLASCIVIPNAADTDTFKPLSASQQEIQAMVGLDPAYFHIGFVGSFQSWIDFDTLLHAIKETGSIEKLRWTIVGNGLRYDEVQGKIAALGIEQRVTLVGRIPHHVIPLWCNAFDICIAPFTLKRNDAIGVSPLKIYEYMACGRPIIATELAGISTMFQESNAGLTYPAKDVAKLVAAVIKLYEEPQLAAAMGKRGRDYAIQHHSWPSVAKRTSEFMQCVIKKQNK